MEEQQKNKPVKSIKLGKVELATWANRAQDGTPYFSFTISKSFKNEVSGEWRQTGFFNKSDLANITALIAKTLTEEIGK